MTTTAHLTDDPTRPASCPFLILDAAGEIAGWCETEDGARTTAAEWSRIDGATYTTRNVNS